MVKPQVIWITGLSGAGKSTLAIELVARLRRLGAVVVMLDGDHLRQLFDVEAINVPSHTREGRLALAYRYGYLCRMIAQQGLTVVIATISLFDEIHAWNRKNLPGYFEVYLKVPLYELRRRDSKEIYRRFDAGEIANVAGLDLPIDEPKAANYVVEFLPSRTAGSLADELLAVLQVKGVIN